MCAALTPLYPIRRAGIVRTNFAQDEFILVAQWTAGGTQQALPARRFDKADTVGEWVLKHRRAFIGSTIDDVIRFPATLHDFEEEGFQSNFVDFVDAEHMMLFFALSAEPDAFAASDELRRRLAVLPHCVRLAELWASPGPAEAMKTRIESLLHELWHRFGTVPTQQHLDSMYFQVLLSITGGRIDGPRGAAALAGVKPSTLRSRIARAAQQGVEHETS